MFNDYCVDEYIATLETVVLRPQTQSDGAIFQLEDDGLMPHKANPDSDSCWNEYFHQVRAGKQWRGNELQEVNYVCQVDEWLFEKGNYHNLTILKW